MEKLNGFSDHPLLVIGTLVVGQIDEETWWIEHAKCVSWRQDSARSPAQPFSPSISQPPASRRSRCLEDPSSLSLSC